MKVSDEMLARAADAMVMINNQASWVDLARAALEAALADVPEPVYCGHDPAAALQAVLDELNDANAKLAYGRSVERQALDARIADLEAKLEAAQLYDRDVRIGQLRELEEKLDKVRAWYDAAPIDPELWELGAILDGKEQP